MKKKDFAKKNTSPFREYICLEYYDGALNGLGISSFSDNCYYFEAQWECWEDCKRVYFLYNIECSVYYEIEKICLRFYKSRKKEWHLPPTDNWKLLNNELNRVLKKIDKSSSNLAYVLYTEFFNTIEGVIKVDETMLKKILSLSKKGFYSKTKMWKKLFISQNSC
jgi:hypothetical protein